MPRPLPLDVVAYNAGLDAFILQINVPRWECWIDFCEEYDVSPEDLEIRRHFTDGWDQAKEDHERQTADAEYEDQQWAEQHEARNEAVDWRDGAPIEFITERGW